MREAERKERREIEEKEGRLNGRGKERRKEGAKGQKNKCSKLILVILTFGSECFWAPET